MAEKKKKKKYGSKKQNGFYNTACLSLEIQTLIIFSSFSTEIRPSIVELHKPRGPGIEFLSGRESL